jgi:AraC-like DNA-binding protein
MDSINDFLFYRHLEEVLDKTKLTRDGYMELIPKRFYAEGSCLVRPAGTKIVVSATDLTFRHTIEHIVREQPEYFCISLCSGTVRGIGGGYLKKDSIYRQHCRAGFCHSGVGITFLPDFLDVVLNSHRGISFDELVCAFTALRDLPLLPDATVLLKQIGGASFRGDIGNLWIEAKVLELIAIVLDWYRRRTTQAQPYLKENDKAGIIEAMRYAEEHFSGPVTLEVLAKQAAMSVSKFTAAFKTHTGMSAASYIRRLRMDKAMGLLKNTEAPLGDIAAMVGYKHHARFSTLFREQFGVMPSSFRKSAVP